MTLKLFEPTLGEVPAKLRHLYRLTPPAAIA
jgi:hypothetical protein